MNGRERWICQVQLLWWNVGEKNGLWYSVVTRLKYTEETFQLEKPNAVEKGEDLCGDGASKDWRGFYKICQTDHSLQPQNVMFSLCYNDYTGDLQIKCVYIFPRDYMRQLLITGFYLEFIAVSHILAPFVLLSTNNCEWGNLKLVLIT